MAHHGDLLMRSFHASTAVLLSTITLAGLGCSKDPAPVAGASATEAQPGSAISANCAGKMASLNAKAGADEKKAYATACDAVSSKAQTCIAGAKEEKDLDSCL